MRIEANEVNRREKRKRGGGARRVSTVKQSSIFALNTIYYLSPFIRKFTSKLLKNRLPFDFAFAMSDDGADRASKSSQIRVYETKAIADIHKHTEMYKSAASDLADFVILNIWHCQYRMNESRVQSNWSENGGYVHIIQL